jgi:hypothetical protein
VATSANVSVVELSDGRRVCLSYGVIVAAFVPRGSMDVENIRKRLGVETTPSGYLRTKARYSVTTSRHMNQFAGKDAPEVDDAVLRALCAPIVDKRG